MASVGMATAPASGASQGQGAQLAASVRKLAAGAMWFYWIAGLSVVNAVLILSGANLRFVIGMGVIDGVAAFGREAGGSGVIAAMVVTTFVAGLCALFGHLAIKKHSWVFWVGMVLYAGDGLLLLVARDFLSVAFHAYVLFRLFQGAMALSQLKQLTANTMSGTPVTAKPIA